MIRPALTRLATLLRFMVPPEPDVNPWQRYELGIGFRAPVRAAFLAADRARASIPGQDWALSGEAPLAFATMFAGVKMGGRTLDGIYSRWRFPAAWFEDEDGAIWLGYLYADDFPRGGYTVEPHELEMIRGAVELILLDAPPEWPKIARITVSTEVPVNASQNEILRRLGFSEGSRKPLDRLKNIGAISLVERDPATGAKMSVTILDRSKLDSSRLLDWPEPRIGGA